MFARHVIVVVTALLLAACGGAQGAGSPSAGAPAAAAASPTAQAAGGGTGDLCTVLTKQEAQGLLGGPVEQQGSDSSVCIWAMPGAPFDRVMLTMSRTETVSDARAGFAAMTTSPGYGQQVTGLGDAAQYGELGLLVLKGTTLFQVSTTKKVPADTLRQLAATVLQHAG
jgi:hypothetical protein